MVKLICIFGIFYFINFCECNLLKRRFEIVDSYHNQVRSFNGPSVYVEREFNSYNGDDENLNRRFFKEINNFGGNINSDRGVRYPFTYNDAGMPWPFSFFNPSSSSSISSSSPPFYTQTTSFSSSINQECLDAFKSKILERHNYYRRMHHSSPLNLDEQTSAQTSEPYAQKLTNSFTFSHNPNLMKLNLGENLYQKMSSSSFSFSSWSCEGYATEAVDAFYREIKSYDFSSGQSVDAGMIGHFTQLVWKNSRDLSVGLAVSTQQNPNDNMYYLTVVCNYNPPGNFFGEYQKNVLPV